MKKETAQDIVFPCILMILPNCIFNRKNPIILGVKVHEGTLKATLCVSLQEMALTSEGYSE